jgi:hypothetical protein
MKRWKKILLVLLVVVIISQLPFAYRRYRLGRLDAGIQQLNSQRRVEQDHTGFIEYKGVIHVHSSLGGHSRGTLEEIIAAANANQLNFVVMTEHPSKNFNSAGMTLKGIHGGVLFINGNEVTTGNEDRLLIMPGDEMASGAAGSSTKDVLSREKIKGALAFVAYPQEFRSWDASNYDGVEVYNLYTNARQINPLIMFFDGLWSYRSYADLLFATFYAKPVESLKRWDEAITTRRKRIVAIAGNDAHANVGISLNDYSGKTLLGFRLDPYERSFHLVRVHVLIPTTKALDSDTLLAAIAMGHCFIAFDLFGDSSGFRFTASNTNENKVQGDEIGLEKEVRLGVSTPASSRVVLLKDGSAVQESSDVRAKEFVVTERGSYRVEIYLPQLPKPVSDQPWIISNPIYVR